MLGITFPWQPVPVELVVLTDSDWAGCKVTRRSTTGIVVKLGGHLLHFSSKLQKSIALSSGEAELGAQVGGLTDGLGIKNLFREFGLIFLCEAVVIPVRRAVYFLVWEPASQGTWSSSTSGYRKRWHAEKLKFSGSHGRATPSDVLTHQSSNAEFKRCLEQLGLELRPDILNNTCPRGSVEI